MIFDRIFTLAVIDIVECRIDEFSHHLLHTAPA